MKQSQRVTMADYARETKRDRAAVLRQAKAHGLTADKDGLDSRAELAEAQRVGKQLDRAAVVKAAGKAGSGNLQAAKLAAQVRKLDVEISILEAERDKANGKLIDRAEAVASIGRRDADLATRITTWNEASQAKRPELRREVEELTAALHAHLAEPWEYVP